MTTQNELKQLATEKGYFIEIVNHTKGKYTQKVTFTVTNVLGNTVYNKTLRFTQNINDIVWQVLYELPTNSFKTLDVNDNLENILALAYNDEEPEQTEETLDDGTNLWDWFESEAA